MEEGEESFNRIGIKNAGAADYVFRQLLHSL